MSKEFKLSKQAKLCIVGLFQKGFVLSKDMTEDFSKLVFKENKNGELEVLNTEICEFTEEELKEAQLSFKENFGPLN